MKGSGAGLPNTNGDHLTGWKVLGNILRFKFSVQPSSAVLRHSGKRPFDKSHQRFRLDACPLLLSTIYLRGVGLNKDAGFNLLQIILHTSMSMKVMVEAEEINVIDCVVIHASLHAVISSARHECKRLSLHTIYSHFYPKTA